MTTLTIQSLSRHVVSTKTGRRVRFMLGVRRFEQAKLVTLDEIHETGTTNLEALRDRVRMRLKAKAFPWWAVWLFVKYVVPMILEWWLNRRTE
jgi:predicted thioesterase